MMQHSLRMVAPLAAFTLVSVAAHAGPELQRAMRIITNLGGNGCSVGDPNCVPF